MRTNFTQLLARGALSVLLSTCLALTAWAQSQVSGTVTSEETGEMLPGVNVIVKGTTVGTVTDIEGNYNLEVPEDQNTLQFSFIGFEPQEIEINGRSTVDLGLASDVQSLEEVIVTAIGIETNKEMLGYSVQNVDGEEIVNAQETNLVNALNSKVAGVSVVSSSGSPGASANIRIRGNTSITGSNEPLFVIDGVPVDNSSNIDADDNQTAGVDQSNRLVDINPNDIADMTVLKGPAATALYGIRAANGAVVITTKRGESGKARVTITSGFTIDEVNRNYDIQQRYAQGRPVGGEAIWRGPDTGEGFSWGPLVSGLEYDGSDYPYDDLGQLVPVGEGNGTPARTYDNNGNFYVPGYTWDNNVSVSGGTEKLKYFLSGGRLFQEGVIPNSDFGRTSFRANLNADLSDKFSVGVSGSYILSGGNRIQRGSNISGVQLGLLRTTPTFDNAGGYTDGRDAADDPSVYLLEDGTQRSYRAGIYDSPFWTVNKNPFKDNVNRFIGNINPQYEINDWLTASVRAGIDRFTDRRNWAFDINSATQPVGQIFQETREVSIVNTDALLIVDKTISNDLMLNATVGHNYYSRSSFRQQSNGITLAIPDFYHISNATNIQSLEDVTERELHGVFADVRLGWREILFLNLTGRNDWSSTLPNDNNSFFYPSASLGFNLSEALDLPTDGILPYAKLRASWGQVGNDAPIYATRNVFTQAQIRGDGFVDGIDFPTFGVNAFERSNQLANTDLVPETTTTWEFGGEFHLFAGRITIDATYYNSETTDQIIPLDISPATGFTTRIANAGVISNEGVELVLGVTPIQTADFAWNINANFTHYETIVEDLEVEDITLEGFTSTSSRVLKGEPYGTLVGNSFQRTDEGQLIIGENGWPLVDIDQKPIGDPNPDWIAGIRNSISYKGFTASVLLDLRQGGDVWNGTLGIIRYFGTAEETADLREVRGAVIEGVVQTGEENGAPVYTENTTPVDYANPAQGVGSYRWVRYGFGGVSEEAIEDASWTRIREVTVSYELPASLFNNFFVSGATVSFTGRNLALWTDYTGIDPETNLTGNTNGFGLDYFNMPNTRSYGFKLRVTL